MKMRRIVAATLLLLLVFLTGCNGGYVPYDYKLDKYIELGNYNGISCEFVNIGVTDADVQQAIWEDLRANGYGETETLTAGTVLLGDILTLDYTGFIDGVKDNALSAVGFELEVGSETFLDEFESGLIGKQIGKSCNISVTFPDVYLKTAYAGKTAEYDITIHSAKRVVCPELTDPIVVDISDYPNVEAYTDAKRKDLEEDAAVKADEEMEATLWQQVINDAKVIDYPKKAIDFLSQQTQQEFKDAAEKKSQTLKEYLADNDLTADEFLAYVDARAKEICKEEMVLHAIARKESISVSGKEINELAQSYAETYGYKSVKELYKVHSKGLVEQTLLMQKVKDFVVENAKQVD